MIERDAPVWPVGLAGLAIGAAFAVRVMLPYGMDPTVFLRLGDESPIQTTYARALLGDAISRRDFAHDGRWFFIQANDPWYVDTEHHAAFLDRPRYRAQRMLLPTVASAFGTLPPEAIVWSLLITNVLWLAVGAMLAGKVATASGLSPWLGLWMPLNPGLLFELEIGGAGILAYALAVGGVWALIRGHRTASAMSFAAAALTKEVMLLFAVGVFALAWLRERRPTWRLVIVPAVVVAAWFAYLAVRLSDIRGAGGGQDAFSAPFLGFAQAIRVWAQDPWHMVLNLAIVAIVVVFVPAAIRRPSWLAWGALPFIGLATVLSFNVWRETHDFLRALAPVFTAIPFMLTRPTWKELDSACVADQSLEPA